MKRAAQFLGSAAATFALMEYTDGMPMTRLLEGRTNSAFIARQSAERPFHEFGHDYSKHLRMSQLSSNEVDRTLRYLYVAKRHVYGFPTVCHGGFSYSLCLTLAEHYSQHFLNSRPFTATYMRYTAPLFVEKPYIADVRLEDGKIVVEVADEAGKRHAIFTATLEPTSC